MVTSFHRPAVYKISLVYDLVAGIGLTTPWTYIMLYNVIASLNDAIFGTQTALVSHSVSDVFFANIGGLALCAWAVARSLHFDPSYLWIDGILKILIVVMQVVAVAGGAPVTLLVLGSALFLIGVAELVTIFRFKYFMSINSSDGQNVN